MPTTSPLLTRRRYARDKAALHERYYGQFVNEHTLHALEAAFDVDQLRETLLEDPELDSIPQKQWDAVTLHQTDNTNFICRLPLHRARLVAAGEGINRTTLTLIARRAARMLVEQQDAQLAAAA